MLVPQNKLPILHKPFHDHLSIHTIFSRIIFPADAASLNNQTLNTYKTFLVGLTNFMESRARPVKAFPTFHEAAVFITKFTRARSYVL
jgi:hypothetical protein